MTYGVYFVTFLWIMAFKESRSNPLKHIQHHTLKPETSCIYGNKSYDIGTHFRPDPCTSCHCTKHGGRPRCSIEDCKFEPNCVHYVKTEHSACCQVCVERGCLHTDGHVYYPGEVVSKTPCMSCVCPLDGGRIQCTDVTCPSISCVDPVLDKDECCYQCLNGPNCWLGDRVIPGGRLVEDGPCKLCHCPVDGVTWREKGGPRAVCRVGGVC